MTQPPPTIPVQAASLFDGSMSFLNRSKPQQERIPTAGQACIIDRAGDIVWTNEPWRRNGSPLPIALTIGDNYCTACRENRGAITDARKLEVALEQLLGATTEDFDLEIACITTAADSTCRHYRSLVRAQAIALNGTRCVLLSHEDVTDARLATAALHASEERHRQFFEAAPDAVFLLSGSPEDNGRILDANTKAAENHGYTREELLTMSIGDLDVHNDAQLVKQRVDSLAEKGSMTFNVVHRRRDGSEFPVEVSARTATVDGKPCIITFNRDISERREFEDALRENKLRTDLAARSSQVGFWDWDLTDNTVILSPEWKAQIGYEPHEIRDNFEEWRSRLHPEDLESTMLTVNNHIEGQTADYTNEFRLQHKDGSYRWIYVRGAASCDDAGKPIRLVGCHVDITASKQAEEERDLLTQRLSQLQRIEAMGTLAGGIAHDFNNILSIIGGNVELALMATDEAPLVESLTEIHKASKRAGSLVRQILSFSREEAPERQQVELGPIVEEAVRMVRSTTPQRITIDSQIDSGVPITFADPEQLHQMLVNLGTNAWHAIGAGTGHVNFRLTSGAIPSHMTGPPGVPADATYAILEIRDDGEGMSDELRGRIFEPFFTTKASGKGTGLGLSVVHGIVTTHQGAIDVESKVGSGTTFRVYLPPSTSVDRPGDLNSSTPSGEGVHVLLVDDEPNLLRVLTRGLQSFGFEVTAMEDPQHAVEAFRDAPDRFHAFITDFDMPGLNGIESTRIIRKIRADLPVLLCSGFLDTKTANQASEAGINRLMTKPILAKNIAQAIFELQASSTDRNP